MILGKLLLETYKALGFLKLESVATGGSTASIVDTGIKTGRYGTNAFKNHIAFIEQTTDGAAPEGEYGLLDYTGNYTASSKTFTIPTVSAAVGAGDIYAIVLQTISLYEMLAQVNVAMGMLPPVRLPNTSLSIADNTLEYTLPAATKGFPIQEIRIGNTTDGYLSWTNWRIRPSAAGSTEKLVFLEQPYGYDSSDTIEIIYKAQQTTLSTYSDTIYEHYPDELVLSVCAYQAIRYYVNMKGLSRQRRWADRLADLSARYNRAVVEHPFRERPAVQPRIAFGRL